MEKRKGISTESVEVQLRSFKLLMLVLKVKGMLALIFPISVLKQTLIHQRYEK
jgi:hypothetical protein